MFFDYVSNMTSGGLTINTVQEPSFTSTPSFWISLILLILTVIGEWKILEKAGEPGWKALIPFYRFYILFKIFWDHKMYWISLVVDIILSICLFYSIFGLIATITVAMFGGDPDTSMLGLALFVGLVCAIARLVIWFKLYREMARCFGQGVLFTIGMFLFTGIFFLILGFSNSYQLEFEEETAVEAEEPKGE